MRPSGQAVDFQPAKITGRAAPGLLNGCVRIFVLLLAGLAWSGFDAISVAALPEPAAEIPFEFRDGLIWLKVSVPQSAAPLNFLLDSGAEVSAIHLPTARRLGLKTGQRVSVRGVHTQADAFWPQTLNASAGNIALPKKYLAVDFEALGDACRCRVDGLVGADFFRDRVVQIDFTAQKIRLLKSGARPAAGAFVPLRQKRGVFRAPLQVNGGEVQWARLDTGCATDLQWVVGGSRPDGGARRVSIGLAEISISTREMTVQLGEREFYAVPTGLHEKEIFPGEAGLLGNGLLARFGVITVDAVNGRLELGTR